MPEISKTPGDKSVGSPDVDSATRKRQLIGETFEKARKGAERLRLLMKDAASMWWSGISRGDRLPPSTIECVASGLFYGMKFPAEPFSRGAAEVIPPLVRRELPEDPQKENPVTALLNLAHYAMDTSEAQAKVLHRGNLDKKQMWVETIGGMLENVKFDNLPNVRLWPIRIAIAVAGRGNVFKQAVGRFIDRTQERLGKKAPLEYVVKSIVTELQRVWNIRQERDKELSRGTAKASWPVEAELTDSDMNKFEMLNKQGLSEEEIMAAQIVEKQIQVVAEADVIFRALYHEKYGEEFNPEEINLTRNREILSEFHACSQEKIDRILQVVDGGRKSVFTKNNYFSFFRLNSDGEVEILNKERSLQINISCYGKRFIYILPPGVSADRVNFTDMSVIMHKLASRVNEEREMNQDQFDQSRREIDAAIAVFLYDIDLIHEKTPREVNAAAVRELKGKVKPGKNDRVAQVIADLYEWKKGDFEVSLGANDKKVFGDNPSNCEMDGSLGRMKHIDVSRGTNGQLVVSEKSVHQFQDGIHAVEDIDLLVEEILRDVQNFSEDANKVDTIRRLLSISDLLLPQELRALDFGFSESGSIYIPNSDCPRELYGRAQLPRSFFEPAKTLQDDLHIAILRAIETDVRREVEEIGNLTADWRQWPQLKERLFLEVENLWQRRLTTAAVEEAKKMWAGMPAERTARMTLTEQDALRKQILQAQITKLTPEYQQSSQAHKQALMKHGEKEGSSATIEAGDRCYENEIKKQRLHAEGKHKEAELLEMTGLLDEESFAGYRGDTAKLIIAVIGPDLGYNMQTGMVAADKSSLWKLIANRDEMNLLFLSPAGLNTAARLFAQAQLGGYSTERIIINVGGVQRLHVSTVVGDQLSIAAASECIRAFQGEFIGDEENLQYIHRTFVQALTALAAFNFRAEVFYSTNGVSNTDLISAESGKTREAVLGLISKTTNPGIYQLYYPKRMASWINRSAKCQRKNGESFASRVKYFPTVLTDGVKDSEGDVFLADRLNIYFRSDSKPFVERAEKETGVNFKDANDAERQQIIDMSRDYFLAARKQEMMMKIFTFSVGLASREELSLRMSEWRVDQGALHEIYRDSFLNYLVYSHCCNNNIEFPLDDSDIQVFAGLIAERIQAGEIAEAEKFQIEKYLSDPEYNFLRIYAALQKYNFAELQI